MPPGFFAFCKDLAGKLSKYGPDPLLFWGWLCISVVVAIIGKGGQYSLATGVLLFLALLLYHLRRSSNERHVERMEQLGVERIVATGKAMKLLRHQAAQGSLPLDRHGQLGERSPSKRTGGSDEFLD
ncbi:hypothetical protein [Roseomonas elaeocarpi]|uniref:DUF2628 domain-containing protein n=1 Tax=Roseomonas elaeocarpi TaxID=907779 RepID=A0ABV6K357_9PROT